ncbi:lecithin retinol acyltransferase family protein [Streptomyces sp. NPDC057199]|uniref:lecithin retinol acyltransferase family protein n=1 Tax=Streptomyces sp. NPDC057199 TaxID=3346047 RepID=UPI00362EB438
MRGSSALLGGIASRLIVEAAGLRFRAVASLRTWQRMKGDGRSKPEVGMARGDHYEVIRFGYRHHGIDIGDGTVVHFTGEPLRKSQATVQRTSWDDFARGDPHVVVTYDGWTWTPDHVCLRALRMVGVTGYQLMRNNCEHFASFCKAGSWRSLQIDRSAERIRKYFRFAVVNPAYILAGPLHEIGYRASSAAIHGVRKMVGYSTPRSSIVGAPGENYFHYVDVYRSPSSEAFAVTPYSQWFRLGDGAPESPNESASHYGTLYVDDYLMPYLFTGGGFFRQAPNDNNVRFIGSLYEEGGSYYREDLDGTWKSLVGQDWRSVSPVQQAALQARIFQDDDGVIHLKNSQGWFVPKGNAWCAEAPFIAFMRFI